MKNRLFTTFWYGEGLNPVAYTSIKSFVDFGHQIQLFTYGNMKNIPKGVILRNAEDILPFSELTSFGRRISNFSDLFRYAFLNQEGGFWVDADVVCIREYVPEEPIYMAYELEDQSSVGAGAIALPKGNKLAGILANYSHDPGLVTPWDGEDSAHRLRMSHRYHSLSERRRYTTDFVFYGPKLLTNAVRYYNYTSMVRAHTDLYAIGWSVWRKLFFDPGFSFSEMKSSNSWAIHCWGNMCNCEGDDILKNGSGQLSEMIKHNWKEVA